MADDKKLKEQKLKKQMKKKAQKEKEKQSTTFVSYSAPL